jgi:hypothetical protein
MNDVHVPHNVPLKAIWQFARDWKPDYLLLVGDIMNMDPFDHWAKQNARKARELPAVKEYYESCNKLFYRPAREAVGDHCQIVHWIGNHEQWAYRAIDAMPGEGKGFWEPESNVECVDAWVRQFHLANLGRLHFLHGEHATGKHHAEKVVTLYRRSVRYGHRHDVQEASYTSPVDGDDQHSARSCGTLERFNPDFMQGRPHNWVHSFNHGVVQPDGMFHDQTTRLIRGKFYANGRVYK